MEEDAPPPEDEMALMRTQVAELKGMLLSVLTKGDTSDVNGAVIGQLRQYGFKDSGSAMAAPKMRIIEDDDPINLRKSLDASTASTADKAQHMVDLSYRELADMQLTSDPMVQRQPDLESLIENMS